MSHLDHLPEHVRKRLLPLQGGTNFRDLGGYPTEDGRQVRWNMLFRSGSMSALTDTDYEHLSKLGIRVICDFRAGDEREREPTQWRAQPAADYMTWDHDQRYDLIDEALRRKSAQAGDVRAALIQTYRALPVTFSRHYAAMFRRLLEGHAPLVFNCSAGKDRTGVAAALVLLALGVDRDTVLEDYGWSDKLVDYEAVIVRAHKNSGLVDEQANSLATVASAVRAPLLASDPEYLRAALDQLDSDYGSPRGFLEQKLSLGAGDIKTLRDLYTE